MPLRVRLWTCAVPGSEVATSHFEHVLERPDSLFEVIEVIHRPQMLDRAMQKLGDDPLGHALYRLTFLRREACQLARPPPQLLLPYLVSPSLEF